MRWYLVAPAVLGAVAVAMTVDARLTPFAVAGVMVPIWTYRARGRLGGPEQALKQIGREIGKSTEAAAAGAVGLISGLWFISEAFFDGFGSLAVVIGDIAGSMPLSLAYWGTTLLGFTGLDSAGDITPRVFFGWALIAFAAAYVARKMRGR